MLAKLGIPACFYLSTKAIDDQQPYWWLRLAYAMTKTAGQTLRLQLPQGEECHVDSTDRERARKTISSRLRGLGAAAHCEEAVASLESQLGICPKTVPQEYPYAQMMTWEDARQLVRWSMTIGNHSVSHPNLTLIDPSQVQWELQTSKRVIEEQCHQPCVHHCYPYGHYSEAVCREVSAAGFVSAVTTQSSMNPRGSDLFRLGRIHIGNEPCQLQYMLLRHRTVNGRVPEQCGNKLAVH
jgi:peptidoglycan/xylan/chitin deacetylase (PgdA/CDA1 family)